MKHVVGITLMLGLFAAPMASGQRNGLTDGEREVFYHLAEGSEVFPLTWLKALKSKATGKPFLEKVERFGLIPDPNNKDGLPVGLTAAPTRGIPLVGDMVGINCAACHVGQLTYKGKSVRVDGAPNLFDARAFFAELVESSEATVSNPEELIAFVTRLEAERHSQKDAKVSPVDATSLKLLIHVSKEGGDLKKALLSRIKDVVQKGMKAPAPDLAAALRDKKSWEDARKRLVEGLKHGDLKDLLGDKIVIKSPLAALQELAERESVVRDSLEDAWVSVRLLQARLQFLKRLAQIGKEKLTVWGPGRVDAFGSVRALYFQEGYVPNSPVSYPHLWGFSKYAWFHWNGNTTSVIERNLGQALGVGAIFETEGYASTLLPANSNRLEELAAKITPPPWPQDLFGKVDQVRVARGKQLFKQHCLKCHVDADARPADLPANKPWPPDLIFDVKTIGTDPGQAASFAQKLPDGKGYDQALADVLAKVMARAFKDHNLTPQQQKELAHNRPNDWRAVVKYEARPIHSIWATAPYLHNGSVPTLYDLLLPAKDRPKKFPVGHREFDPIKLGYRTDVTSSYTFDSGKTGNSNAGHEYGVNLTKAQRLELLEYLKTH